MFSGMCEMIWREKKSSYTIIGATLPIVERTRLKMSRCVASLFLSNSEKSKSFAQEDHENSEVALNLC